MQKNDLYSGGARLRPKSASSAARERIVLRHDVVTRIRDGRSVDTPVSADRLPDLARDLFGVELPAGPFVFESYSAVV